MEPMEGKLPGYDTMSVDSQMQELYGYCYQTNNRINLDGRITDYGACKALCRELLVMQVNHYEKPGRTVGHQFVWILTI